MGLERLSLQALGKMDDGRLGVAFDQALNRAESDCRDRPGVKTARKVTITAIIEPQADERGDLASVDVHFEIADTLPKRRSQAYNMRASASDGLVYNDLSREDVNQGTFEFDEEQDDEEKKKIGG